MTGTRTARRLAGWLLLVALVELTTRALVYALAPSANPLATRLAAQFGGPRPVVVVGVVSALAVAFSAGILWLASMGVRERWSLAPPPTRGDCPRIPVGRVLVRAGVVWVASMIAFSAIESWIHLRAGLGFHGLGCLLGPVHRNAIPLSAAVAMLAAACVSAAAHLLAWMGRVVETLRRRRLRGRPGRRRQPFPRLPLAAAAPLRLAMGPRAPPGLAI